MVNVNKLGILLQETSSRFERDEVLNLGVIKEADSINLFHRAKAKDKYSTKGYCKLAEPTVVESRNEEPIRYPQTEYKFEGLEDQRIVEIEGTYFLCYTAFDGINALGTLATSTDLIHWKKHGVIVPQITCEEFEHFTEIEGVIPKKYIRINQHQNSKVKKERKVFIWDKNLLFFPRKIDNKLCFLHPIKPDIQVVVTIEKLEDLTIAFWQNYLSNFDEHVVMDSRQEHEVSYIGGGCPPIETEAGWLIIYNGVHDTGKGYVYSACAALLDLNNPQKEIARLPYPLFYPEKEWELKDEANNVCFPTDAVLENDTLYIYYRAADKPIAVASVSLKELLVELETYKN